MSTWSRALTIIEFQDKMPESSYETPEIGVVSGDDGSKNVERPSGEITNSSPLLSRNIYEDVNALVTQLFDDDSSLDPVEYWQMALEYFPNATKQQVKNKVAKLRLKHKQDHEVSKQTSEDVISSVTKCQDDAFVMYYEPPTKTCVLESGVDFEVRAGRVDGAADTGVGVFAKRKIVAGEFIVLEKAILSLRLPAVASQTKIEEVLRCKQIIEPAFRKLSSEEQERVMELYDFSQDLIDSAAPSDVVTSFIEDLENSGRISTHMKGKRTPWGVFLANCIPGPDGESRLCYLISRFNHSCSPNAFYSCDGEENYVRATRDIEAEAEIVVHYMEICPEKMHAAPVFDSRNKRRKILLHRFGFVCNCCACAAPTQAVESSDRNRRKIVKQYADFPALGLTGKWTAVEAGVRENFELMKTEGVVFPGLLRQLAHDVCRTALRLPGAKTQPTRLLFWKRVRYEVQRFCHGMTPYTLECKMDAEAEVRSQARKKKKK